MGGKRHRGANAPETATFAALLAGVRDTIRRDGPDSLLNAALYADLIDVLVQDIARQGGFDPALYRPPTALLAGPGGDGPTGPIPEAGNHLNEILRARGITKAELARRVGASRYGIQKLAKGSRPSHDMAQAIANALDTHANEIFPPISFGRHRKEARSRPDKSTRSQQSDHPET